MAFVPILTQRSLENHFLLVHAKATVRREKAEPFGAFATLICRRAQKNGKVGGKELHQPFF